MNVQHLIDAWVTWDQRPREEGAAKRLERLCQEIPDPTRFRAAVAARRRNGQSARDAINAVLAEQWEQSA